MEGDYGEKEINLRSFKRICRQWNWPFFKRQYLWIFVVTVIVWRTLVVTIGFTFFYANPRERSPCTPVNNVIFLKTHKTGSTTVANVMYRYSKSNNLKVVLPKCAHRFCWPFKFKQNAIYKHKENDTYNMMFHHAVFHKQNILEIIDKRQTKFVTILREPYSQLESAAQSFNFKHCYKLNGKLPILDELFSVSDNDLKKYIKSQEYDPYGAFSLSKNPNAFDMGFDPWNETTEYIKTVLKSIEKDFSLVMITEYMEESLVLLKNELCWNLKDIAFFIHNVRLTKDVGSNNIEKTKTRVLNWNKMDAAIYDYFNKTLWKKIKNSGISFQQDLEKLKKMNFLLKYECATQPKNKNEKAVFILKNKFNIVENITELCSDLQTQELDYTDILKQSKN
ncbi:galactose-3-O-sulfotransferase 4 isoform X1 [Hydra vulgaris]|uniref:galactose-3-O-sulfotransferase 4 isoform X1 n=1 Tax=Hydra vulgaris TaxID=6087 RepID=UPI001F5FEEC2|nr:galactose-3-O-sulfotransferase 4-like [Hydra vulgaris]